MINRKAALGTALVGTALFVLAACGATHGDSDSGKVDHAPADVILFPAGYRNVAHKCDGPNMVYSGSSGKSDNLPASVYVVANDPRCH